ncbi:hypothetical protein V473_16965 [Sphingobium cupriresistens LL01]|uniref:Uncharacterized protein n=1 Tax=Sphingobium cupriresistens LL01 TaxID=1420583 RepID=A0A0J8AH60_9SPHN|nr:hypothetical protein V473_16965 [Sphingobium cupriresistens LL01]
MSTKRYITMLYCNFSIFDTVENTVMALALVFNQDSNRCGRFASMQIMTVKSFSAPCPNLRLDRY